MRPAITRVLVFQQGNGQMATVVGPIDLEAPDSPVAESDVYLWTRVSPDDPHEAATTQGREAAEAMGADELDLEEITSAAAAAAASGTADVPAMWKATVPVTEGRFNEGDRVFVEVWALVRTKNRQREFQVYWYDNDVEVKEVAAPTQSSAPTTATA